MDLARVIPRCLQLSNSNSIIPGYYAVSKHLGKKGSNENHFQRKIQQFQDQSHSKRGLPIAGLNPPHKIKHGIARAFDYTDPRTLIRRATNEHGTILVRLSTTVNSISIFPFLPILSLSLSLSLPLFLSFSLRIAQSPLLTPKNKTIPLVRVKHSGETIIPNEQPSNGNVLPFVPPSPSFLQSRGRKFNFAY